MGVYNWDKGYAYYPGRQNRIADAWAHRLEHLQGTPNGYLQSGEYTYTENLLGIKQGLLFQFFNTTPKPWVVTSCIGSGFDIRDNKAVNPDYCTHKGYNRITPP